MPRCPGAPEIEKMYQQGRNKAVTRHIEAVIRSKNVVKRGLCYYSDKALENGDDKRTLFILHGKWKEEKRKKRRCRDVDSRG